MGKERLTTSDTGSLNAMMKKTGCTCGHYQALLEATNQEGSNLVNHAATVGLEASFVHLPLPPPTADRYDCTPWMDPRDSSHDSHPGFLETLQHSSALVRAAEGRTQSQEPNDPGVSLCQGCVERVAAALDADTDQLKQEAFAYTRAVEVEEERQKLLKNTLGANQQLHRSDDNEGLDSIKRTARAFHDEIAALKVACEQHEQERKNLQFLQKEQAILSKQLDNVEDEIWEERNAFELEARAFDNVQAQLSSHVMKAQQEVESLSRVRLHSALFDLVVDKRGLRYPLINELRLAYRPKGDVRWSEINAAWSQAAQLLLFVGASVKFRPRDWRIVPLTLCAKVICLSADGKHRAVYNLGGRDVKGFSSSSSDRTANANSMAMSLRALNQLLDQMIRHTMSVVAEPPHLPFDISRQRIGSYDLSSLEESNDSGWSRVIHCMACNLQWLSGRASDCILQEDMI